LKPDLKIKAKIRAGMAMFGCRVDVKDQPLP
jgi:hypothetical protein